MNQQNCGKENNSNYKSKKKLCKKPLMILKNK